MVRRGLSRSRPCALDRIRSVAKSEAAEKAPARGVDRAVAQLFSDARSGEIERRAARLALRPQQRSTIVLPNTPACNTSARPDNRAPRFAGRVSSLSTNSPKVNESPITKTRGPSGFSVVSGPRRPREFVCEWYGKAVFVLST
jgi:hypothetical protein